MDPRRMPTASPSDTQTPSATLGRLLSGSSWLALQFVLQIGLSLWSVRLIVEAVGPDRAGAYRFALGFGFLRFLFEFGLGSSLQRQLSEAWAYGDRARVDRLIACGVNLYAAVALLQAAALLAVAFLALPRAEFDGASRGLVLKLMWLQAIAAPFLGLATVVSSVLQAARRFDFVARCEVAITVSRFAVLLGGVKGGFDFFWIAAAQAAAMVLLRAGPSLWVMVRELGHVPRFRGARWSDYLTLGNFGIYLTLMQISTVLSDQVDTTILGFVLAQPGPHIAVYDVVSKPYLLLRQAGMMLSSMVMPAVAGLTAAGDERGLERIKYDGTRLHLGMLLPIALLAWIYAAPFLSLWIGTRLGDDAAEYAPLMRLFLVAAIPLSLAVPVQMATGLGRIRAIALAALAGALVNVPLSCYLTARLGLAGVIWGTLLTTLVSNYLIPGIVVARVLGIDPSTLPGRTMSAPLSGTAVLIASAWILRHVAPIPPLEPMRRDRALLLALHLGVGTLAYVVGYASVPAGRGDVTSMIAKLRGR